MNEEIVLYLVSLLTFIFILKSATYNKQFSLINLGIFLLYSLYFYYGLFFRGEEGMSLGWLLSIFFVTGLHLIFIIGYIVVKSNKIKK